MSDPSAQKSDIGEHPQVQRILNVLEKLLRLHVQSRESGDSATKTSEPPLYGLYEHPFGLHRGSEVTREYELDSCIWSAMRTSAEDLGYGPTMLYDTEGPPRLGAVLNEDESEIISWALSPQVLPHFNRLTDSELADAASDMEELLVKFSLGFEGG